VISVDDHVVEPPDLFDGRVPARFAGAAPRIVETELGHQVWRFEEQDRPRSPEDPRGDRRSLPEST
jgi:hypothetical protein